MTAWPRALTRRSHGPGRSPVRGSLSVSFSVQEVVGTVLRAVSGQEGADRECRTDEQEQQDQHRGHDRHDYPAALEPEPRLRAGRGSGRGLRCHRTRLLAVAPGAAEVPRLVAGVAGDRAQERTGRRRQGPQVRAVDAFHRPARDRARGRRSRWWRRCRGRGPGSRRVPGRDGGELGAGDGRGAPLGGSFVSRPRSTGSSGPACTIGAGWSDTTRSRVAIGSPRSKGGRPSTAV